jgi:hypothetical protein
MVNADAELKRKRLFVLIYILAGCVGVLLGICGFIGWRDEGFYVGSKFAALRGKGGGFYTFLLGLMLIFYSCFGSWYHLIRVDQPEDDAGDKPGES